MSEKITYSYYTSALASQNAFFRLPRALYEKECFRGLSNDVKTLYALMLDRMSLSLANQWLDEDGKVYINYSLEDIMTTLNCGKTKAVALLKELDSESEIALQWNWSYREEEYGNCKGKRVLCNELYL